MSLNYVAGDYVVWDHGTHIESLLVLEALPEYDGYRILVKRYNVGPAEVDVCKESYIDLWSMFRTTDDLVIKTYLVQRMNSK
jgi:hypothetical protein